MKIKFHNNKNFDFGELNNLESFAALVDDATAAIFVETIQGEGGINPCTPEFLRGLRKLCDERNLLLLVDEVQCGIGRTGAFYAFQHAGITPDAIGMALEEWRKMKQGIQQDLLSAATAAPATAEAPVLQAQPVIAGSLGELMQLEGKSGDSHLVGACPDCGSQMEYAEGCVKCHVCGFSECG